MSQEREVTEQEAWSGFWRLTLSKGAGSDSKAQGNSQDSSRNSGPLSYLPRVSDRDTEMVLNLPLLTVLRMAFPPSTLTLKTWFFATLLTIDSYTPCLAALRWRTVSNGFVFVSNLKTFSGFLSSTEGIQNDTQGS